VFTVYNMITHQVVWEHKNERNLINVYMIQCHPRFEEIFITGSTSGDISFWDINRKSCVRKFNESVSHEIELYVHPEIFDGTLSNDGTMLIIATSRGHFSIYSLYSSEAYYSTPIEQFLILKEENEYNMSFEQRIKNRVLTNVDSEVYKYQPPLPNMKRILEQDIQSIKRTQIP